MEGAALALDLPYAALGLVHASPDVLCCQQLAGSCLCHYGLERYTVWLRKTLSNITFPTWERKRRREKEKETVTERAACFWWAKRKSEKAMSLAMCNLQWSETNFPQPFQLESNGNTSFRFQKLYELCMSDSSGYTTAKAVCVFDSSLMSMFSKCAVEQSIRIDTETVHCTCWVAKVTE